MEWSGVEKGRVGHARVVYVGWDKSVCVGGGGKVDLIRGMV